MPDEALGAAGLGDPGGSDRGGGPEADAFATFVAARYPALARSAYLLLGDRDHAEDLVQTALIKTLRAWPRLAATEAAEAYTRTTMVRLAGRWSRRHWRGEIPSDIHDSVEAGPAADPALDLDVRAALAALPWSQRAVLVLRYFDDLSEQDTAAVLRCRPGTVKSRASRALATLRDSGLLDHLTRRSSE
jgi:RNA polymerase sigma-70 factor (sigma-E family)